MRLTTILLIVIIIFASGLFSGLMYNPVEKSRGVPNQTDPIDDEKASIEQQIEAELYELNDIHEASDLPIAKIEHVNDHPIEKVAGTFEKGTTYFFEKIVSILYSLSELAF